MNEVVAPRFRTKARRTWELINLEPGIHLTIGIEDVNSSPEIVSLSIEQTEGQEAPVMPITVDLLRSIPLRRIKLACLNDGFDGDPFRGIASGQPRRGRAPITADLLRRVADTYRAAQKAGLPTGRAIQENEHVANKTAERYVKLARERGFLEPAKPKGK